MLPFISSILNLLSLRLPLSGPNSDLETLQSNRNVFEKLIQTGSYRPYVWPYCAIGPYLMIFYLLLPPTKSKTVIFLKYPIFVAIIFLSAEAIIHCRSAWATYGYGIGLMNAWAILWSATLLIFQDARLEARRIEARTQAPGENGKSKTSVPDNASLSTGLQRTETLTNRGVTERSTTGLQSVEEESAQWTPISTRPDFYVWQDLPDSFLHRLDWVLDLGFSFRGPRWTHQIAMLPGPPRHVQVSLADSKFQPANKESQRSRQDVMRHFLPRFIVCNIMLDILKNLAMQDPYFWGLSFDHPSPFAWPRASRTLLSVIFVYHSLQNIFLLAPIVGCVLLGTERIGEHGWPWLYPPYFGPLSTIANKGLAGAWGQWWQQLFRMAFEQTGDFVGNRVGWDKRTQRGVMLRVVLAFLCSGILHACASYTTIPATKPWHALAFFVVQPIGTFAQRAFSIWLKTKGWRDRTPEKIRQLGNIMFVVVWFYFTGPMIADDFARCGIWLYEPIPISPIRWLRGQRWWRWTEPLVKWHADETWWKSGFAF